MIIDKDQLCQAYDGLMSLKEKSDNLGIENHRMNLSCFAPAFVYMEGTRGKRFLCDYHYFLEKNTTLFRTPEQWPKIVEFLIDNTESIKDTFADFDGKQRIPDDINCWCGQQAFTLFYEDIIHYKDDDEINFKAAQCNFHFRKTIYRYISNGIDPYKRFKIIDERKRMKMSINEEFESLTTI